jgi:hypothetical protein
MHNVRVMWLKAAAKESKPPDQLDRATVTAAQAIKGLEQSREALHKVIETALANDGQVRDSSRMSLGLSAT